MGIGVPSLLVNMSGRIFLFIELSFYCFSFHVQFKLTSDHCMHYVLSGVTDGNWRTECASEYVRQNIFVY